MSNLDELLKKYNKGDEEERAIALRAMLDLESDEEGETDPFYAGGDDEQNDPDFLPNVEFDCIYFLLTFCINRSLNKFIP